MSFSEDNRSFPGLKIKFSVYMDVVQFNEIGTCTENSIKVSTVEITSAIT